MDSFFSFLVKLLIGGLMVLAFVGLWGVGIELSDVSNFKQQVNYTIERDGGLTQQAIREISTYARTVPNQKCSAGAESSLWNVCRV